MNVSIAICMDPYYGWHERFAEALAVYSSSSSSGFWFGFIDIDANDWIDSCLNFDVIIFKPSVLGVEAAQHYKEKIFFIEKYLNKLVFPNYNTVWHYESKIAQSYLLKHYSVRTPSTFVSFDYHDSSGFLESARLPLVFKESCGAGGSKVKLIKGRLEAQRIVRSRFSSQLWREHKLLARKANRHFNYSNSI